MTKNIILLLIFLCISSKVLPNGNVRKTHEIFIHLDTISYTPVKLIIKTFYESDSVDYSEKKLFQPIVLKQEFLFFKHDTLINRLFFSNKSVKQLTLKKEKKIMMDNVASSVKVYDVNGKIFFYVVGFGGCNTCSEHYVIFNAFGERLTEYYYNLKKTYINYNIQLKKTLDFNYLKEEKNIYPW